MLGKFALYDISLTLTEKKRECWEKKEMIITVCLREMQAVQEKKGMVWKTEKKLAL